MLTARLRGAMGKDDRALEQEEIDRISAPAPLEYVDDLRGLPDWHLFDDQYGSLEKSMRYARERHLAQGFATIDCPSCNKVAPMVRRRDGTVSVLAHYAGWGERCETTRYFVSSMGPTLRSSVAEMIQHKRKSVDKPVTASVNSCKSACK